MSYYAQIKIQRVSESNKIYVYRSSNAEDINTIDKIKNLNPILEVDESIIEGDEYVILDSGLITIPGVTYFGPEPNTVPSAEYESVIDIVKINNYTYLNALTLYPLKLKYNGTMYYYSIIGVNEENNTITHISKVNAVLIDSDFKKDGTRHIYSCDNFTGNSDDEWKYVAACPWDESIVIGNKNIEYLYSRYGNPFVETVPVLDKEKISCNDRTVSTRNFLTLRFENPWYKNNKKFNFRKLKSFKIQNVLGSNYSRFSEPTYQSELPVYIEKLLILCKEDPDGIDSIDINDITNDDISVYQIIRRDGIFYNDVNYKKLGLNLFTIPLGEHTAIFNEASMQEYINFEMPATLIHDYLFTFYLIDIYKNISEPVSIRVNVY